MSISICLRDSIHLSKGISVHQRTDIVSYSSPYTSSSSMSHLADADFGTSIPKVSPKVSPKSIPKEMSASSSDQVRADCLGDSLRQARSHPVWQMVLLEQKFLVRRVILNCIELCMVDFWVGKINGNITQFLGIAWISVILHKCVLQGFNISKGKIGYTVHFLPKKWQMLYKIDNNCYGNVTLSERFLTWPFV